MQERLIERTVDASGPQSVPSDRPARGPEAAAPPESVDDIIRVVRRLLGMDVAFVAEFVGENRIFRHVDPSTSCTVSAGATVSLHEGFCKAVVDGRLPELMPDVAAVPAAAAFAALGGDAIGAHVGVPIRLRDQSLYGTFCCFSANANPLLNGRDLTVMRAFAELLATQIDRVLDADLDRLARRRRIEGMIAGNGLAMVFQPVVRLEDRRTIGVEALARFVARPPDTPDAWFAEAAAVGLQSELECAAVAQALAALPAIPLGVDLAVNVSPGTILSPGFEALFDGIAGERVILELTEHADVPVYAQLDSRLAALRTRKVRLAIDDAGAGYASLRHILNLKPDIIKLDTSLTRNVNDDPARRSLAMALVSFAADIGCQLVAEGVETEAELQVLRSIGVAVAQGYYLGRPGPLASAFSDGAG